MVLKKQFSFSKQLIKSIWHTFQSGINLFTLLKSVRNSEHSYLNDGNCKINYAQLYHDSFSVIEKLRTFHSNQIDDQVVLLADNSFDFIKYLFALSALSKEIVIISPHLSENQLETILQNYRSTLIITDHIQRLKNINRQSNCYSFDEINSYSPDLATKRFKRNNGKITILSTGTSNMPTPVERKLNITKIWNPFIELISRLELLRYSSCQITVPFYHGYGLASLVLGLFLKQDIHFTGKFSSKVIAQSIINNRIDCLVILPAMMTKIIAADYQALGICKCLISGGDKLEPTWVSFILNQYPATKIFNLYGTTELGICSIATQQDLIMNNSTIGRFLKGIKYRLQENQELQIRCPWIQDRSKRQYLSTGDFIRIDKNGLLYYLGRMNDSSNIGGHIVHGDELAKKITAYPSIIEARVIIYKNEILTPELRLKLTLKNDAVFDQDDFKNWLDKTFPKYLQPKSIDYSFK